MVSFAVFSVWRFLCEGRRLWGRYRCYRFKGGNDSINRLWPNGMSVAKN